MQTTIDRMYLHSDGDIDWLGYDHKREWLMVYSYTPDEQYVKWMTLDGGSVHWLNCNKTFGFSSVNKAIDKHPELPWIAVADDNKWLIYDYLKKEKLFEKEEKSTGQIVSLNFHPEGKELWVNIPSEMKILVYDIDSYNLKSTIYIPANINRAIQWDPSGEWFMLLDSQTENKKMLFGKSEAYALDNSKELISTARYSGINGITFSQDGKYMITSDDVLTIYEFPLLNRKRTICHWAVYELFPVSAPVVFTKNNREYLFVFEGIHFYVFDFLTGKEILRRWAGAKKILKISNNLLAVSNAMGQVSLIDPVSYINDEYYINYKVKKVVASKKERERYLTLYRLLSIHRYESNPEDPEEEPTTEKIVRDLLTWEKMDISKNNLKEIPSLVFELKFLESLDVSDNCLLRLSPKIKNLKRLKSLSIDNNQLTALPNEMEELKHLDELYINNNPIKRLQPFIKKIMKKQQW